MRVYNSRFQETNPNVVKMEVLTFLWGIISGYISRGKYMSEILN